LVWVVGDPKSAALARPVLARKVKSTFMVYRV
jgi:hypothetical protein